MNFSVYYGVDPTTDRATFDPPAQWLNDIAHKGFNTAGHLVITIKGANVFVRPGDALAQNARGEVIHFTRKGKVDRRADTLI